MLFRNEWINFPRNGDGDNKNATTFSHINKNIHNNLGCRITLHIIDYNIPFISSASAGIASLLLLDAGTNHLKYGLPIEIRYFN